MNHFDLTSRVRTAARTLSLRLLAIAALGCGLLLGACSGGGGGGAMSSSGSTTQTTNSGVAMVTLTDMPGDFVT